MMWLLILTASNGLRFDTEGYRDGYPMRIVDQGVERLESLARLAEIKATKLEN